MTDEVAGRVYGEKPAEEHLWFTMKLECLSEEAAASAADFVFVRGLPFSQQTGAVMETYVAGPGVVMRLAEDAVAHGWATDPAVAQLIVQLQEQVDARRTAANT